MAMSTPPPAFSPLEVLANCHRYLSCIQVDIEADKLKNSHRHAPQHPDKATTSPSRGLRAAGWSPAVLG